MPEENARLMALYRRQAKGYDQSGIQGLDTWRREAVSRLALQHGDLQGLNKAEMAAKFGEAQVLAWRRSYDIPPPELSASDARYEGKDPRAAVDDLMLREPTSEK